MTIAAGSSGNRNGRLAARVCDRPRRCAARRGRSRWRGSRASRTPPGRDLWFSSAARRTRRMPGVVSSIAVPIDSRESIELLDRTVPSNFGESDDVPLHPASEPRLRDRPRLSHRPRRERRDRPRKPERTHGHGAGAARRDRSARARRVDVLPDQGRELVEVRAGVGLSLGFSGAAAVSVVNP